MVVSVLPATPGYDTAEQKGSSGDLPIGTHDRPVLPDRGAASLLGFLCTFAATVLSCSRFRFTALLCEPSLLLPDLALTAIVIARLNPAARTQTQWPPGLLSQEKCSMFRDTGDEHIII